MLTSEGGDCAESFDECTASSLENKFKILLQMSLVIVWLARKPVVRIARMAGQFAKPRTAETETVDGKTVYSFKGDNVNSRHVEAREPDPERLIQAYFHSAATLNYVRAMIAGGVADLHSAASWSLAGVRHQHLKAEYEGIIERITDSMQLLKTIQSDQSDAIKTVEFYTSHEGLLLAYETALTETDDRGKWYNRGAHFLWIGDRTRNVDGAHVEYFRGVSNPIGVKIGPTTSNDELAALVKILNPHKELGRLSLITRYGAEQVAKILPGHIAAVQQSGIPVLWICDPMHGNTEVTAAGLKTRNVERVMQEMLTTFDVHQSNASFLGNTPDPSSETLRRGSLGIDWPRCDGVHRGVGNIVSQ